MGCSGALFGIIGYMFVDVIVNWKNIMNPVRELVKLFIVTIISLVLGLLPGLDNFAHLGMQQKCTLNVDRENAVTKSNM